MEDVRPKTIFCDIDGCILKHFGDITVQHHGAGSLLSGVKEAFKEWDRKGYKIILCSGRRENVRHDTERQLASLGVIYDTLLLGITGGERVLINDTKPEGDMSTARAIMVKRNDGLTSVVDL